MTRVAIYTRVARPENEGTRRQLAACRNYADDRGWTVVDVYTDGVSQAAFAATIANPELHRLFGNLDQYDVVLTWHLDRLTRNSAQLRMIVQRAKEYGVEIATVA